MNYKLRLSADGLTGVLDMKTASVVKVRDVVMVSPVGDVETKGQLFIPHPDQSGVREEVLPDRVELDEDVAITRLERAEADRVFHACAPRGHHFLPYRQAGQAYTFARVVPSEMWIEDLYRWDPDAKLRDVLAMARLIVDAGYSTEYAARIVDYSDGDQKIIWTPPGPGKLVYRVGRSRDWLTYDEADQLKSLLHALWAGRDEFGERLKQALWNLEFAAGLAWMDVMIPLYVIILEPFTNTRSSGAKRQFIHRVPRMSVEAGGPEISEETCGTFFKARSAWAHGGRIELSPTSAGVQGEDPQPPPEDLASGFAQLQTAARSIVRHAIEDPAFRAKLETKNSIERHWPVPRPNALDETAPAVGDPDEGLTRTALGT